MRSGLGLQNNVFTVIDNETGSFLDGTVSIQLPAFALQTNEYNGAGLAGAVNVPSPAVMTAQQCTITCNKIYGDLHKYLMLGGTRTLQLYNDMVVLDKDNHSLQKVPERWILKGPMSGGDPGQIAQGSASDSTFVMEVYYAQHFLDGDEVLEWDVAKYLWTVAGEDLTAETRQNIMR